MNRLSPNPISRRRIRPRAAVLSGTALGLIAGGAAYIMISSASVATSNPTPFKPASASAASAPSSAAAAPCARDQKLEHGVCIVRIQRTVVVAAPRSGTSLSAGSSLGRGSSSTGENAAEGADQEAAGHDQPSEHAEEVAEHVEDAEDAEDEAGQP